jgi:6-phosphogluconate dehydrogenase
LTNLVLDPFFTEALKKAQGGWRRTIALGAQLGIPMPTFSIALAFYDSYRAARLPANLLQAQRDYFGAHTYERTDKPRGEFFHSNWTGLGGTTSSTSYNV